MPLQSVVAQQRSVLRSVTLSGRPHTPTPALVVEEIRYWCRSVFSPVLRASLRLGRRASSLRWVFIPRRPPTTSSRVSPHGIEQHSDCYGEQQRPCNCNRLRNNHHYGYLPRGRRSNATDGSMRSSTDSGAAVNHPLPQCSDHPSAWSENPVYRDWYLFPGFGNNDLTSTATWSSSNTAIATVSTTGLATVVACGTTTITAEYQAVVGQTQLTVQCTGNQTLQSITVLPGRPHNSTDWADHAVPSFGNVCWGW